MDLIHIAHKTDDCRNLWERLWPQKAVFDLWPVRACFQKHYQRPLFFLSREQADHPPLFLALSWIEEEQYYGHFPGETWQGKTWLEQNKIIGVADSSPQALMEKIPGKVFIRYLDENFLFSPGRHTVEDEIGYLFTPGQYDYSFETYRRTFPGKTRKKFDQEIRRLETQTVTWHYDRMTDVDQMMRMNLAAFGEHSYFHDPRFFGSFIDLLTFFKENNMLRVTSVLIGGRLAAVDVGALWNNTYTVIAGGTDPEFPGVAKLINFHHIEWACRERLGMVDFLCGDFAWKTRFRLQPRPLYKFHYPEPGTAAESSAEKRSGDCGA
ncbi:MAG: GNAT family N-acetyltransferase [Thermodesulfobacteriota bacterium]